ncbi:NUDIX hydrolase [Rhodococcus sp. D2-41]|uniref:NUDIX hydrolase n=1 Tax=Speluncibacter jeojiensis TaxID=2710754 RepID=A0A9X4RDD3_9ACTN|nr:NUDIX hydrolase [Rhodococcus sp. D2-41]MDG3011069.1 NUDIX hydrolase [Rhodococcus sp. D2-41]MDG3014047.1 NUDIX hydrolase [Corynebacteriales bacterium D3-21]
MSVAPILAAGGVLWRRHPDGKKLQFAVIHRPRYDDWSLPKGKLDPGETPAAAAVREIAEETGAAARLDRHLCQVSYPIDSGRIKQVDYWSAQALSGEFEPNGEVDRLQWLSRSHARAAVTQDIDREVLDSFVEPPPRQSVLLVVRHAKAGRRGSFDGDDTLRPLDRTGRGQAERLIDQLLAFGATDIHTADRTRCIETVTPLANRLGTTIHSEPALSEEAYATDPARARKRAREIAADPGVHVLCSQSGVIPDLMRWWADRDSVTLPRAENRKASTWVLFLSKGILQAADHLGPPPA